MEFKPRTYVVSHKGEVVRAGSDHPHISHACGERHVWGAGGHGGTVPIVGNPTCFGTRENKNSDLAVGCRGGLGTVP
jgi:hypothetical protein